MRRSIFALLAFVMPFMLGAQEVMSPELLWDLKRVGSPVISPDGGHMLFTIREYAVEENGGLTKLYIMSTDGRDIRTLVDLDGSQYGAQWKNSEWIGFLNGGDWYEVKINGTSLTKVLDLEDGVSNVSYSPMAIS